MRLSIAGKRPIAGGKSLALIALVFAAFLALAFSAPAGAESGFLTKWGEYGSGNGEFNLPYGVAADSNGSVYVVDSFNHRVQKFDSNGGFVSTWGILCGLAWEGPWGGPDCDGGFFEPQGIAISSGGDVYVVDTYNHRIQKFDQDGAFMAKWGSLCDVAVQGSDGCDGQFRGPYGAATDPSGKVYVADTWNHRIQKFDQDGNFIAKWGSYCAVAPHGEDGCDGGFAYPTGVAAGSDGDVYVADVYNHRIQKFDENGNFVAKWGSLCRVDQEGQDGCDGDFYYPTNLAAGASGDLYVADLNNHIQKFDSSGGFVSRWGGERCIVADDGTGDCDGLFNLPYGIAAGSAGDVYVADTFNHRVQKFGELPTPHPGPKKPRRKARLGLSIPPSSTPAPSATERTNGDGRAGG